MFYLLFSLHVSLVFADFRSELDVRRQAGVDEALGVGDRPFYTQ
jgi:hypothetical protein